MNDAGLPPSPLSMRIVAAFAALIGPLASWAYESGRVVGFEGAPIPNMWVVAAVAFAGLAIAVVTILRGSRNVGVLSLVSNFCVATIYGFFALIIMRGGIR